MRSLIVKGVVIAAGFTSLTCVAENKSVPALDTSVYVEGSLCKKPDQIVFSCPLVNSKKIVSMCVAGSVAPHRFYYAFGKPYAVELTYPANGEGGANTFQQARLLFPGAIGGYAYSFTKNPGYKYIIYSVSGSGFDISGLLVQRQNELRAISDMKCQSGKLKENAGDSVQNAISAWGHDRALELHGLPHVSRG